jgi:hypothetical protein
MNTEELVKSKKLHICQCTACFDTVGETEPGSTTKHECRKEALETFIATQDSRTVFRRLLFQYYSGYEIKKFIDL